MIILRFFWATCWVCLLFNCAVQAKDPARYNLKLDAIVPKAGVETEMSFRSSAALCRTNEINGQKPDIANLTSSVDLAFRSKCLNWDDTNGYAKIEMVVDHGVSIKSSAPDEVIRSGTRIDGMFIAGEWFFHSPAGPVPQRISEVLTKVFSCRPGTGNEIYARLQLDQPRAAGESWKVEPRELFKSGLRRLDDSSGRLPQLISILDTNHMQNTVEFVGLKNISGMDHFQLRQQSKVRGEFNGLIYSDEAELNISAPVDSPAKNYSVTALARCFTSRKQKDGANRIRTQIVETTKTTLECRQVSKNEP